MRSVLHSLALALLCCSCACTPRHNGISSSAANGSSASNGAGSSSSSGGAISGPHCTSNTDCIPTPSTPACDTAAHVCVQCLDDNGCALGSICSMQHTCVPGCDATHGCG